MDFKGNTIRTSRRLALEYRTPVDWRNVDEVYAAMPTGPTEAIDPVALGALAPVLEPDAYTSLTTYDALNRQCC